MVKNEFKFNTATQWQQDARSINKQKSYNDDVQMTLQSLKADLSELKLTFKIFHPKHT